MEDYLITCIVYGELSDYLHCARMITRLPELCKERYPITCIVHGELPDYLHFAQRIVELCFTRFNKR